MSRLVALVAVGTALTLGACSGCGNDTNNGTDAGPDGPGDNRFDQCGGDAPSFVRQSFLSLVGRRPKGQAEVNVYADLYKAAADQLHLPDWDASILRKLGTLESIYGKLSDRQAAHRMEVLEWIVIFLIAFEIVAAWVVPILLRR